MSDRTIRLDHEEHTNKQLVEALGNVWFQGLLLAFLAVGVPVAAGIELELWQWPVLVAVPTAAWCFGTLYGRCARVQRESDLL
jgi:hypothetical protein